MSERNLGKRQEKGRRAKTHHELRRKAGWQRGLVGETACHDICPPMLMPQAFSFLLTPPVITRQAFRVAQKENCARTSSCCADYSEKLTYTDSDGRHRGTNYEEVPPRRAGVCV